MMAGTTKIRICFAVKLGTLIPYYKIDIYY